MVLTRAWLQARPALPAPRFRKILCRLATSHTNFFLRPQPLFLLFFHLRTRRAHLTIPVTVSQRSARLARSFSHISGVECNRDCAAQSQSSGMQAGSSRISMPSIYNSVYNTRAQAHKLGPTQSSHTFLRIYALSQMGMPGVDVWNSGV